MANEARILILGGYGMAGQPMARLLLKHTPVSVVIAGRHAMQAEKLANDLNREFIGNRASGVYADASKASSLRAAFRDVTLVIDCTATTKHIATVTRAALDASVDYLDILFGPNKVEVLQRLAPEIERAGRCFITEAGYHPGLPAAFVCYGAARLDSVESAVVGGLLNMPIPYTEAVDDLVREIEHGKMSDYRDGAWRTVSWSGGTRKIDFGAPHGVRTCSPMDFYEMHGLPERYGLRETGFYIAGMNWFADWAIFMPWYLFKLGRFAWGARLGAKLLAWSTKTFTPKPYEVVLKLEAVGCLKGEAVRLELVARHPDGYAFTAIPVVACIRQYLDGSIRQPGLWVMGQAVEPTRLMRDMQAMGIIAEERLIPARVAEQARSLRS